MLWSAPPVAGFTTQQIVQAVPTADGPDLYSVDTDFNGDLLVRAFKSDGEQMWVTSPSLGFSASPGALGDNNGGIIVWTYNSVGGSITDFDPQTGNQKWQYSLPASFTSSANDSTDTAVGLDGTLYFVEDDVTSDDQRAAQYLDAVSGTTGKLVRQIPLPASNEAGTLCDNVSGSFARNAGVGPPTVAADGSVYVELDVQQFTYTESAPPSCQVIPTAYSDDLSLLRVLPDGGTQMQTLTSYGLADVASFPGGVDIPIHAAGDVIPDGEGGVLASWASYPAASTVTPLTIADIGPLGNAQVTLSNFQEPGYPGYAVDNDLVLGDNNTAFTTDGFTVVAFDATSLQEKWSYASAGGALSFVAATSGGGVAVEDSQLGLIQIDASGNPSAPVAGFSNWGPWALGMWPLISNNVLAFVFGPDALTAPSIFPESGGGGSRNRGPQLPTLVHYVPFNPNTSFPITKFETDILGRGFIPATQAHHVFRLGADATLSNFLADLKNPIQGVGFIGHSIEDPNTGLSVGICFADSNCLVEKGANITAPQGLTLVPYLQVPSQSAVLFFASCNAGSAFDSLWGIQSSTKQRALIVPQFAVSVALSTGVTGWMYAATALASGQNASSAKNLANDAVARQYGNFTWSLVGDATTTITTSK